MTGKIRRSSNWPLAASTLILAAVLLAFSGVQEAAAETPPGTQVVRLPLGKKGRGFSAPGVRVSSYGRGHIIFGDAGLLVADVAVSSPTRGSLILRDGIKLRRGRSTLTVRGIMLKADGRRVTLTGRIGSRRTTIATGRSSKPAVDAGRIAVEAEVRNLRMTRSAVSAIRRGLGKFKPRTRTLGRMSGGAYIVPPPDAGGPSIDPTLARSCRPATGGPADPAQPGGAVDVTCGSVIWNLRDSWIGYLGSAPPIEPAATLPAVPGSQHLCPSAGTSLVKAFYFSLPVRSGWWDAASSSGAIYTAGGAHFLLTGHGLDIAMTEVEIRFNGTNSKIYTRILDPTHPAGERLELATFNAATPRSGGPLAPGTSMTRLDTLLTTTGSDVIGNGFYGPGAHFGCIDVGFNF